MAGPSVHEQSILRRILVGAGAGAAGSLAMNVFARIAAGDRRGHGVQPPQGWAPGDDATVRAGTAVVEAVGGHPSSPELRDLLGTVAHYAFGAANGVLYALLAPRRPWLRFIAGTSYGVGVWAVADEMLMPALGLSRGPRQLTPRTHAYSLAGHVIYGAVTGAIVARDTKPLSTSRSVS
jgi:hypothetical protein